VSEYRPLIIAGAIVAVLVVVVLLARPTPEAPETEGDAREPLPTPAPAKVVLFFPGDDGMLHREPRDVFDLPAHTAARARLVMEELIAGSTKGLAPVFPWPILVEETYADTAGNVFVDFSSPPVTTVAGTSTELLLVYATVNSIVANCPGSERVQVLFGGREVKTLGHLDLSRPLLPRPELVAR